MRVYKYELPGPGITVAINYTWGARAKLIALQNGVPHLWAEVHPDAETRVTHVTCIGTGWDSPDGFEHIGTILDGQFVWHFYMEPENAN